MSSPLIFNSVPLIKAVATGNDFVMVDLLSYLPEWRAGGAVQHPRAHWAKAWCNRHFGLGADGALFLEAHDEHAFQWDFYNSDGSQAEMCGNAARAVSLYYHRLHGAKEFSFVTRSGVVDARVHGLNDIEVTLAPIAQVEWNVSGYDFVRAGVPHAVVQVAGLKDRASLSARALAIKGDSRFADGGTNVTFVHLLGEDILESVTFERGVEGFTLACGTGAVAAAFCHLRGQENRAVEVRMPGGAVTITLHSERPHLRGGALLIAEARWVLS